MAREKILVVDPDRKVIKTGADEVLSSQGFQVLMAHAQDEAIDVAVAKLPHLLMLDLPLDAASCLLHHLMHVGSTIPSILILEQEMVPLAPEFLRLGVRDYIGQPFTIAEMLQAVGRVLGAQAGSKPHQPARELVASESEVGRLDGAACFPISPRLMLTLALKATRAEAGMLAWTNGGGHPPAYYVAQANAGESTVTQHKGEISEQWWGGRTLQSVIDSGQPLLRGDVDRERNGHDAHVRSWLAVPLRRGDRVLGAIHLESSLADAFSQDDLQFVLSLSDQVAIALEAEWPQEQHELEQEFLLTVMDAVDNAIWVVDADLRLLALNGVASDLLGWSQDEVIGHPICTLMPSGVNSPTSLCQLLSQVIQERRSALFPGFGSINAAGILVGTKEGRAIPVTGRALPMVRNGLVVGAICAFREALPENSDKHVRFEFANMASHLLRSPLSFIQAGIDLMLSGDLKAEEQNAILDKMRDQSQSMRDFIGDLLEMSRLETGLIDIYPQPVILPPLIKRVINLVQADAPECHLSFAAPTQFPVVAADPAKMELILLSLLHAAMKRCLGKGDIRIELSIRASKAIVSVMDDGETIPTRQLDRIFSQFYPVDDENKMPSTYQLGLYSTKRLIELQNGRVWAESRPGEGSRFDFSLPLWGVSRWQ